MPLLVTMWKASPVPIMVTYPEFELSFTDLTKQMCHVGDEMNHFWGRWRDKYIVEQRDSHHCSVKDAVQTQISVRAVVVAST